MDEYQFFTYNVFISGFVEPQVFVDEDPLPLVMNQWLLKRHALDKLDCDYEAAMETYGAALDNKETLGDGAGPLPDRPTKTTITEDLLLTFRGTKEGKLGGCIFVGNIMGLRVV